MRTLVLSLLLCAGIECLADSCLVAAEQVAEQVPVVHVSSWSLAVPWKAMPIHPLPQIANLDKAYADVGISAEATLAVATAFDDHAWLSYAVPNNWESYGAGWEIDGEAVFRVNVEMPATTVGKDLEISLGAIDDFDDTFFNGELIGRIDKNVLGYWTVERVYHVPGRLVVAGTNVIAVRIFDHFGGGGFVGPKNKMLLRVVDAAK